MNQNYQPETVSCPEKPEGQVVYVYLPTEGTLALNDVTITVEAPGELITCSGYACNICFD